MKISNVSLVIGREKSKMMSWIPEWMSAPSTLFENKGRRAGWSRELKGLALLSIN